MKTYFKLSCILLLVTIHWSCQDNWLDREPPSILIDEQVWNDPTLITGVLSNYYDRLPAHVSLTTGWVEFAAYDEAMWAGLSNNNYLNNYVTYPVDRWTYWDYGLIRDINLSIDKIEKVSTELTDDQKRQFISELRFIRAYIYFELVKRMGGVPIVTEQLIYDFSGDPSYLQVARSKEEDIYDFVAAELEAIMDVLGNDGSITRANRFTALALKSRVMLYAGSTAKYNGLMVSPITTFGNEVGIPASRADAYYTLALAAAEAVITEGPYTLYQQNADLGENFYEAITTKTNNTEAIWVQDFLASANKRHLFTYDNIVRAIREDNLASSALSPSLNLVEDYEYLDGSTGTLKNRTADNTDYIYYDNPEDIFANKDARLYGTIIYPGSNFKGNDITVQAGVMEWNTATNSYDRIEGALGSNHTDGELLTSPNGPHRTEQDVSNTGFYLRKYVDTAPQSSTRGIQSDMWWIRLRLGEIYLNAAEAAFELGQETKAVGYINTLRERAGFPENSLTDLTFDRIRNERRVELAFEDHIVWDLKRWRLAHEVWNGDANNPDANVYALYPYRVINTADPAKDGKYVFEKIKAPRFLAPRFFRMDNYYSLIPQSALNNNPKLVKNPFH